MAPDTLEKLQNTYTNAIYINWMFDKYIGDVPAWENKEYVKLIKMFDYYFCSLKGVADKLKNLGLTNIYYLPEACDPNYNGETYINYYQSQKYGEDISFVGTIGLSKFHPNRIPILKKIINEGYRIKIWGGVACEWKLVPKELKEVHVQEEAINDAHSKVVQNSLINLGIDQDPNVELGFSARLYRVLCAGGLYLTTYTKGLENMFKINKQGELPTKDLELVVYYDMDDLIKNIDFLLEHEDIRKQISINGQKIVLEKHKFSDRINDIKNIIEENKWQK